MIRFNQYLKTALMLGAAVAFVACEKEEDNKLPLMRLEKPVNLVFKTEDIEKMKTKLSESTMIGMDTEWKPVFTKFDKGRAALF